MTSVSRIVGLVALLGTSIVACGARTGLDVPKPGVETVVESDGGTCTASNVAVEPNVPNLYFVLDISESMADNGKKPNKWDNIRIAVASLIGELGANARFAAWVFPNHAADVCAPGVEKMGLRLGDAQGAAANAFTAAVANIVPGGGTPTSATFQALLPVLKNLPGETFAILATDGGPNCDSNINTCSIDQCTTNIDTANSRCNPGVQPNCCDPTQPGNSAVAGTGCLDGDATAQAVSDLRAAGVRTYVMGIPGSAPYASVLDQLAVAGGTARNSEPRYFAVDSSDEAALASGFEAIATAAMRSCVLTLHDTVVDPDKVNVYVDGAAVPNGPDGWSVHGQTITLQGMTCAQFGMSPADAGPTPVHVTQGCPTLR